jgi:hypothetical protein
MRASFFGGVEDFGMDRTMKGLIGTVVSELDVFDVSDVLDVQPRALLTRFQR